LIFANFNSVQKNQIRENDINKVCFATGGCNGTCPVLAIEIDSSLTYKLFGGMHAPMTGYFTGSVSHGFWDTLNIKFEHIDYKQIDTLYDNSVDDLSTETILYFGNKRKHIYAQSASLPDSIMTVFRWLMSSYKNAALTKIKDGEILFETRIHNRLLPKPIFPSRKFLPPKRGEIKTGEY
jgi:hypothetical protein